MDRGNLEMIEMSRASSPMHIWSLDWTTKQLNIWKDEYLDCSIVFLSLINKIAFFGTGYTGLYLLYILEFTLVDTQDSINEPKQK